MCLSIFRSHYGDTLYSKMTSEFDPEGVAALSNRLGMCLDLTPAPRRRLPPDLTFYRME